MLHVNTACGPSPYPNCKRGGVVSFAGSCCAEEYQNCNRPAQGQNDRQYRAQIKECRSIQGVREERRGTGISDVPSDVGISIYDISVIFLQAPAEL